MNLFGFAFLAIRDFVALAIELRWLCRRLPFYCEGFPYGREEYFWRDVGID